MSGGTASTGQRTRRIGDVIQFLTENADRDLSAQTVANKTGHDLTGVHNVLSALLRREPERLSRVRPGVYRWTSGPAGTEITEEPQGPPGEYLLEVLARQADGKIIVRDTETEALYVLTALSV